MKTNGFDRSNHMEMCADIDSLFESLDKGTLDLGALVTGQASAPAEQETTKRLGNPGTYDFSAEKLAHWGSVVFPNPLGR